MITTAVILARGLGSRMRAAGAALDASTAAIADRGTKALIPDSSGRPFLDHVLQDLADAGVTRVVLVIGPEHTDLRAYYSSLATTRLTITFAEQLKPLGTADAVAAAESAVEGRPFLVINSDNRYPVAALADLARLDGPGLVGFTRTGLLRGNIPADRIARFAVIAATPQGHLARIMEKPPAETLAALGANPLLSMNCWAFTHAIFAACRAVVPSSRGELELPDAVSLRLCAEERLVIVPSDEAVLDLSCRDDVAAVRAALPDGELRL